MAKARYVWDIESFPNFLSFVFKNVANGQRHRFIMWAERGGEGRSLNDFPRILEFLEKSCSTLIGYNSDQYDDPMASYMLMHSNRFKRTEVRAVLLEMNQLSRNLIDSQSRKDKTEELKALNNELFMLRRREKPWKMIDLILQFNTIDRVSLKQLAISMRWPVIADLPHEPTDYIEFDDIAGIMRYNDNDVDITEKVLIEVQEGLENRIQFSKKHGIDLVNSCDSDIAKKLLAKYYMDATGVSMKVLRKMRTSYRRISLNDCVADKVRFETPYYRKVLEKVRKTVINPNIKEKGTKKKKQFEIIVKSNYLTHTMGLGGIHSNNPSEIMTEDERYAYIDLDVASFYPWLLINEGWYPRHLGPQFIDIYRKQIVEHRMRIKHSDPVFAYTLKIVANATFGLTKSEHSWLYDPMVTTSICVSGQLYLMMLMEQLELKSDCKIVYSNTDGLTVRVPREQMGRFYHICGRWETYTGLTLEYARYKRMVMANVNNYMIFAHDERGGIKIKAKGWYNYKRPIHKGYYYPIIGEAVRDYYEKDIPVEITIRNNENLFKFVRSERTSPTKFEVRHFPTGGVSFALQKNNRWIATRGHMDEGRLYRISRKSGEKTAMESGALITPINNIDEGLPLDMYKIDYSFYIRLANKLANLTKELNKETHIPQYEQSDLFE